MAWHLLQATCFCTTCSSCPLTWRADDQTAGMYTPSPGWGARGESPPEHAASSAATSAKKAHGLRGCVATSIATAARQVEDDGQQVGAERGDAEHLANPDR